MRTRRLFRSLRLTVGFPQEWTGEYGYNRWYTMLVPSLHWERADDYSRDGFVQLRVFRFAVILSWKHS